MVRIKGSMPAERVENLVKERLDEFGLKMKDIAATTTDGAGVMKSFGRMICCVHQLCFADGYHLAVTDFLYAGKISLKDQKRKGKIIILDRIQNFLQNMRWKKLIKLL